MRIDSMSLASTFFTILSAQRRQLPPSITYALLRSSPILLLAAALIALAVFFVADGAAPAQGQSISTTMVSNTGQSLGRGVSIRIGGLPIAQGFTTGSSAGGYTLTSIEAVASHDRNAAQAAYIRAELWSATAGNMPDSKVADLTVPSTISTGPVVFTAPNTALSSESQYFFVLRMAGTPPFFSVRDTSSVNEDPGRQSGWSIADRWHIYGPRVQGSMVWVWKESPWLIPLKIRVNGYEGQNLQGYDPGDEGGSALPAAVTLSLGSASVSESAGEVTVTATLDAPAPMGGDGISLNLYAGGESTADQDADYTMPDSIVIAAGERSGTASITVIDDAVDEDDETVHVSVFADLGVIATLAADAMLTIVDDDGGEQQQQQEQTPQENKYADLISRMYDWRNDPQWSSYKSHTDKWDRTLLAFGETVSDGSLTPMTAAEAQAFADTPRGTRWVPVAAALWEIEGGAQQQPTPTPEPTPTPTPEPTSTPTPEPTPTPAPEPDDDTCVSGYGIAAQYDVNDNDAIEPSEYRQALSDYQTGKITYKEMIQVGRAAGLCR